MSTYDEGIARIADDVLLNATPWNDLTESVTEYAEGWGTSPDTVGDDVLQAINARFHRAIGTES